MYPFVSPQIMLTDEGGVAERTRSNKKCRRGKSATRRERERTIEKKRKNSPSLRRTVERLILQMRLNMIHYRTLPREVPLAPSDQTPVPNLQLPSFPLRSSSSSHSTLRPFSSRSISTELVSSSASDRRAFAGGGGGDSDGCEEGFDESGGDVGTVVGGVDGSFVVGVWLVVFVSVGRVVVVGGRVDLLFSFSSGLGVVRVVGVRCGFKDWKGRERE